MNKQVRRRGRASGPIDPGAPDTIHAAKPGVGRLVRRVLAPVAAATGLFAARGDPRTTAATAEQIAETYAQYRDTGYARRWGGGAGNQRMAEERDAWLLARLTDNSRVDVLDLGCGAGNVGSLLDRAGRRPRRYIGVDLLDDRLALARDLVPWGEFLREDVRSLPLPAASVDVAVALTLFSSLAADPLRVATAAEVQRVIRPGGRLLVYDIRLPSPRNPSVRPISADELRRLFPGWSVSASTLTLLPPLARRVGSSRPVYRVLSAIPLLRSHLAVELISPAPPGDPAR